ncbi:unnamed protein product, partial [Didymodactylos carnosus]
SSPQNLLSYSHGASTVPLLGETIGENLRKTTQKFPKRDALIVISQNYRANYEQLWHEITMVAKGLLYLGVRKGDRIGIWSPNRYEWVVTQYAIARIGAILVSINPSYRINELKYVLNQSGIKLVIAPKCYRTSEYEQLLHQVKSDCHNLEKIIILENDWNHLITLGNKVSDEELDQIESHLQFDDPVNIQYTSGTTGYPKGVTLSHHNILNNGFFTGKRFNFSENDRICIQVPFYHCSGMVMGNITCTSIGACIIVPSETFDAEKVMKTVQEEKCTSLSGVPTMFISQLEHKNFHKYDFSSVRVGVMGGSTCPTETLMQIKNKMNIKEFGTCYGSTETSPVITQTFVNDSLEKRTTTAGKAHDHVEIKIVHPETGEILRRGEVGEVCTRGYHVMMGYWNNTEETMKTIDQSRWLHTGDLGTMDSEGYLNIVGRIKEMIIRGGENIYPKEIEEFLRKHPLISDVQVIGVPSRIYGEEVMAWIKLKSNSIQISEKELNDFCKNQISHYKIPKYWKFIQEFPMTVTGKIRKGEMKEISVQELNLKNEKV